ncbi:MAG: hypothetical protein IKR57_00750 [Bacilli bacterium]|nr:hypothetical protein [Bacilli bacterium]
MKKRIIMIAIIIILIIGILAILYFNNRGEHIDNINKITIKFYPGYNIATAEGINDITKNGNYVDEVRFDLTGEDFKKAKKFFSNIKQTNFDFETCDCVYMMDEYEVYLNDNIKISMGDEFGIKDDITFEIPEDFSDFMYNLILNYSDKNIYKSLISNTLSINKDGVITEITDKNEIDTILHYKYFIVNNHEDFTSYDKGPQVTLILDNNTKVYLYGGIMGYIESPEENTFIVFLENKISIYKYIENIFENRKLNLKVKLNVDVIKVEYKENTYEITDKNKIEEITKELLTFRHYRPNYILNMKEETSVSKEDIKIIFNNCRYYILGNKHYGNRYFVDENNVMYDVEGLISSNTEKYIKELVNYKE